MLLVVPLPRAPAGVFEPLDEAAIGAIGEEANNTDGEDEVAPALWCFAKGVELREEARPLLLPLPRTSSDPLRLFTLTVI